MASLRSLAAALVLLVCLAPASCGGGHGGAAADGGAPITPGSGNRHLTVEMAATRSSEQQLLAQVYAQAIRAAGFRVRFVRGIGAGPPAVAALEQGRVNAYARYARVRAPERRHLRARGVSVLASGPPLRSYGVALLARSARKYKLGAISDLSGRAPHWILAVPRGCERDSACASPLERSYGLRFKHVHPVRPDLVHEALRTDRSQASLVATTDPHIRRSGEALLDDDKHVFPAAAPVVLARTALVRRGGRALQAAVARADDALTVEVAQELNARVEFDAQSPARVAHDYLRQSGLLPHPSG
jgi:osmoprotectant transport system substrate-binding protein